MRQVATELSPPPVVTSVHRPWSGMTVQLHDWKCGGHVTSPAVDHDIIAMRMTGRVQLLQDRAGTIDRRVAGPGNVTIHARGYESRWSWDRPGAIMVVRVPVDVLREAAEAATSGPAAIELRNCFGVRDPFVERIMQLFALELRQPPHPAQELISGSLSAALATHLVQRFNGRAAQPAPDPGALGVHALDRTLDHLHGMGAAPLTLAALAGIAGVSPFHFARHFRRSTGEGLLEYLRRTGLRGEGPPRFARRGGGGLADWQVRRATSYLEDHLDSDVTLDELAALLDLSRAHFCTAFRTSAGVTPREWAIRRRLERSREMLANPRLSITEIALGLGYSPSAFGEMFRKRMGVTPSAYRRSL